MNRMLEGTTFVKPMSECVSVNDNTVVFVKSADHFGYKVSSQDTDSLVKSDINRESLIYLLLNLAAHMVM